MLLASDSDIASISAWNHPFVLEPFPCTYVSEDLSVFFHLSFFFHVFVCFWPPWEKRKPCDREATKSCELRLGSRAWAAWACTTKSSLPLSTKGNGRKPCGFCKTCPRERCIGHHAHNKLSLLGFRFSTFIARIPGNRMIYIYIVCRVSVSIRLRVDSSGDSDRLRKCSMLFWGKSFGRVSDGRLWEGYCIS